MATSSTRGVAYTKHLDETLRRGIYEGDTPNWNFLYEASTTRNPDYYVGDTVLLPNGKGFVYCKSGAECWTGQSNVAANAIPATGIDYSLLAEAVPAGQDWVKMTNQGTVAQTLDGLRGGTITFAVTAGATANVQSRGIVGNTAGGVSDVITIYLDAAITTALTSTASYAWCMPSPYSDIRHNVSGGVNGCQAQVGPATIYVSAADMYFWTQFKGRVWMNSYGNVGSTSNSREVVWRYDGSVQRRIYNVGVDGAEQQVAGYVMDNNSAANGATEIMLTGNV